MAKKAERNVDKIKRLEAAAAAERDRRRNADIEIIRMHKVVNHTTAEAALQLAEISTATDGLLAALALHCGAPVGPDAWEITLDAYSPTEMCKQFSVSTDRVGGKYVIRVERKGDGK